MIIRQPDVLMMMPVQTARHPSNHAIKTCQVNIQARGGTKMKACWRPDGYIAYAGK